MSELHKAFRHTDLGHHFPRPKFHMVMLYIEEEVGEFNESFCTCLNFYSLLPQESIRRQMLRWEKVQRHNQQVANSGEGTLVEARNTDKDRALARERYRIFREEGYEPLKTLRSHFNYHFIAADGSVEDVSWGREFFCSCFF